MAWVAAAACMRLTAFDVGGTGLAPPFEEFSEIDSCRGLSPWVREEMDWARETAVEFICGKEIWSPLVVAEFPLALDIDGRTALSDIFSEVDRRSLPFFF